MGKEEKKKKFKYKFLVNFILKILILCGIVYALLTWVITIHRLDGNYMFPSVRDGDLCIFYKLDDCHLDDIVIYKNEDGQKKVGRVLAVGGQEIDFPEEGGIAVNGYAPSETITYQTFKSENSIIKFPLKLNEDELFVMNDFRSDTSDSREIGAINKTQLQGKLIFVLRRRGF